jgi:hypothetical protein
MLELGVLNLTLPAKIGRHWKGLPETNTLAYFGSLSATKKKVFKKLLPGSH